MTARVGYTLPYGSIIGPTGAPVTADDVTPGALLLTTADIGAVAAFTL